ncbi:ribose-phosphate diphosphokinase [Henriciella aquimarina]|uniref:ribose-phosphate diphosphokinase n=1 Tax=Henriciella aquimarina TaxID=545261 RepID=UPI000A01300C|nr:ribose-phosphate diphosphokinase [Henriciella aquimarina]
MTRPPLLYALPGSHHLEPTLRQALSADAGELEVSAFPDGESYLRFQTSPAGQDIILLACLNDPDAKFIPLLFAAKTAHDLGARSVGLIAPYMPYFRQDVAFNPGESVNARHIGALLSDSFDWVVTLDPHLHRLSSLADVFTIPGQVAQSADAIAAWIQSHVETPMLFGPDAESEQWVSAIANACDAPYAVFLKTRHDSRSVDIDVPSGLSLSGYTPVIVDDIVSTGGTLGTLVSELRRRESPPPVCCVVHGLFSEETGKRLSAAGAGQVVTTTSVPHPTNAIDIVPALADATDKVFSTLKG